MSDHNIAALPQGAAKAQSFHPCTSRIDKREDANPEEGLGQWP
ncbi:MAG: hypothetical protein NTY37_12620 [Methanothrix sp.]|nr:hypothetical protein [Methanothrix sp.]